MYGAVDTDFEAASAGIYRTIAGRAPREMLAQHPDVLLTHPLEEPRIEPATGH
jgi:hypothetical protein